MKYPITQYNVLLDKLPTLIKALQLKITINEVSPALLHDLHYNMFVQTNYPSDHYNVLNKDGKRIKLYGGTRLFEIDESFLLYPDGCNDPHIETAMKAALKHIYSPKL